MENRTAKIEWKNLIIFWISIVFSTIALSVVLEYLGFPRSASLNLLLLMTGTLVGAIVILLLFWKKIREYERKKEAEQARRQEEEKRLEIVRVTKAMEDAYRETSLEKAGKILEEAGISSGVDWSTSVSTVKVNLPDVFWSIGDPRLRAVSLVTACRHFLAKDHGLALPRYSSLCSEALEQLLKSRLRVDPSGTVEVILNLDRNRSACADLEHYLSDLL